MPLIYGIIVAIATFLGKLFTDKFVQWVAIKALIITAIMVLLPLVLKDVIIWFVVQMMTLISSHISGTGTLHSVVINVSGVGGYLASTLQLPLCFSVIISALILRITLNFIPFIK